MLTAKGDDVDRIVGLEIGADDYLPKPFNPRELLARIHAVLGPVVKRAEDAGITIVIENIEDVDPATRRALVDSFASPAKMRVEASRRLSKLEFDRDLIANRIRSLYEWFSIYDTTTSTHEFVTRVFNTKLFPMPYLQRIIERAELRFPSNNWRTVPVLDLCDIVEEVALLMAEFETVNVNFGGDKARRLGESGKSISLGDWSKQFQKVFYTTDSKVFDLLSVKADDSKKLTSKKELRYNNLESYKRKKMNWF
jgi:hypothetical protein